MAVQLDNIDRKILKELQLDASQSLEDIAKKVATSKTPVWNRIKKLRKSGVIKNHTVILDAEKLVFSAQRNLANARLDLVLNQLRLKKSSGLLNTSDLAQLDQWFN